jgi:hypothetical protein
MINYYRDELQRYSRSVNEYCYDINNDMGISDISIDGQIQYTKAPFLSNNNFFGMDQSRKPIIELTVDPREFYE